MSKIYFIEATQLNRLFVWIKEDFRVFAPVVKEPLGKTLEADYCFARALGDAPLVYNPFRTVEPLKSFFTPAQEKLLDYFSPSKDSDTKQIEKNVIFGVKSCDIAGHKVQDYVFLEGVEVDNQYRLRRENTLIISSDCTGFKTVCHCLAWDILPHPTVGFDINLSPLNDGYLAEVGSAAGEDFVQKYEEYFSRAKETQINARKKKRENFIEQLKKHLLPQNLVHKDSVQKLVKDGYNLDTWQEFMQTCVECGGCNLICDTCHCFLLADRPVPASHELGSKENSAHEKLRLWDSCLYANYARVAGGANPLKMRAQRLRNRFMKKFDFFEDNLGMPACCGCGRCIEVCPGKIDIREVLKDLAKKLSVTS
jgi:heterodisulfide reductase subunit C